MSGSGQPPRRISMRMEVLRSAQNDMENRHIPDSAEEKLWLRTLQSIGSRWPYEYGLREWIETQAGPRFMDEGGYE